MVNEEDSKGELKRQCLFVWLLKRHHLRCYYRKTYTFKLPIWHVRNWSLWASIIIIRVCLYCMLLCMKLS